MTEIWKEIKGYEGYYEVSNLGRVRSMVSMWRFYLENYSKGVN